MNRHPPIQVFEYDRLPVDEEVFTRRHWEDLLYYNSKNDNRFFDLLLNGVRFKQFVGVIQVGNLTIEVLPKVDRSELSKASWQTVLLEMLRECHWMQVHAHQQASLRLKHNSILDAYLEIYLNACERLLYEGLVKKYRKQEENLYVLKGKLKFARHISRNVVHQERFFTEHSTYDRDNIYNQILLKALKVIPRLTYSPLLMDKLSRLLLAFPELQDIPVTAKTFQNLVYGRKTERYKEAIEVAAMLLLNYRPDVRGGRNHVLAILFDMNELWEEYFYRRLRRSLPEGWTIKVQAQARRIFWESRGIKPDIVLHDENLNAIIIDTKWKMPDNNQPSDPDLKQIFVYNEYWGSSLGILLYPQPEQEKQLVWEEGVYKDRLSRCVVSKISVLQEGGKLDRDFTLPLVKMIEEKVNA